MILKGNARGSGSDLATHLMNGYDNERVELADIRGTIANDLHGAFAEIEAISSGTRAQKPFYSLSINPSEALTREQYFEAIEAIENKLGLSDQARAVVFHIKEGREHCHVAWSRIDGMEMKAIHMAHDRRKLCDMAVELSEKFGHELPEGLKAWKEKQAQKKDALEATLAEKANEQKTGISPEERRDEITAAYGAADSAEAFKNALEEKGYVLAKGDWRSFVVVDQFGDVHSLSRYVKDVKAKEIKARLSALDPASLPDVEQAKEQMQAQQVARDERAAEKQKSDDADQPDREDKRIAEKQARMEARQKERRLALAVKQQKLLTRQQEEKLSLHAAQKSERGGLFFRARAKVADLIKRTPALRSVLGHITARAGLDPRDRHKLENEALERRHGREKRAIDGRKAALEKIDKREERSFQRDLKRTALRKLRLQEALQVDAKQEEKVEIITDARLLEEAALRQEFNAEAVPDGDGDYEDGEGEDDRGPRKSWKQRELERQLKRGPGKGKGYGYKRDD